MIKYKLVSNTDPDELAKDVNKLIEDGWVLYGNVVAVIGTNSLVIQGLTKEVMR